MIQAEPQHACNSPLRTVETDCEPRCTESDENCSQAEEQHDSLRITITWRKSKYDLDFHQDGNLDQLFHEVEDLFNIPATHQKYLVPKNPMLKWPLQEPDQPLHFLQGKQVTLMGSPTSEVEALDQMSEKVARRNQARMAQKAKARAPARRAAGIHTAADSHYTFLQVKPLEWLPRPERSQMLLLRLKSDPGIQAVMKKRKFTVALLTEMEPLQHTQSSHEGVSRTLGLNRNQGEVIELRLRTDAHDGYRDYKTIRKTLCHELTHNVHTEHDRNFWDLCGQIEKEVAAADWKHGGHSLGESSRYAVAGLEEADGPHADEGGWTGGEFVLGGRSQVTDPNSLAGASSAASGSQGWSRRDILARAATERQKKEDQSERKACKGWRPCHRSQPSDQTE